MGTFVVGYLEAFISANPNATEAEIEKELDALCNVLGPYAAECPAFVNAELPQILQWVENETPNTICQYLHLCPKNNTETIKVAPLTKLIEPVKAVEEQVVGGAEALPCSLCEIVVGYAESYVQANPNATVAEVEKILGEFCSLLGSYSAECTAFIDAETPQIINYLTTMTPKQVCTLLKLCSSAAKINVTPEMQKLIQTTPVVKLQKRKN